MARLTETTGRTWRFGPKSNYCLKRLDSDREERPRLAHLSSNGKTVHIHN